MKKKAKKTNKYTIPTYKLPFIKRAGRRYPFFLALFWVMLSLMIILPIMQSHNWDLIYLLYTSPLIITALVVLISSIFSFTYMSKYLAWGERVKNNPSHVTIDTGPPGAGKSLLADEETSWMAKGSWEKIKEEYWFLLRRLKNKNYTLTEHDKEIKEAFEYYISHDGIPCLATNIPAWSDIYRRYSYKLTPAFLKQEKKCPYRLVAWCDELGTVFNPDLHLDSNNVMKSEEISDMSRYCRQFCELRLIGTEQEGTNIYKNIRRVVGSERLIVETKVVLKPKILTFVYKKLMAYFTKRMYEGQALFFGKFMECYKDFLSYCGFLKVRYRNIKASETGVVVDVTTKKNGNVVYIPCGGEMVYLSRAFQSAYGAKDKPLDIEVWNRLSPTEQEAIEFLRATSFYRKQAIKEAKEREKEEKKKNK